LTTPFSAPDIADLAGKRTTVTSMAAALFLVGQPSFGSGETYFILRNGRSG
jgi:hypothetical protein